MVNAPGGLAFVSFHIFIKSIRNACSVVPGKSSNRHKIAAAASLFPTIQIINGGFRWDAEQNCMVRVGMKQVFDPVANVRPSGFVGYARLDHS